MLKKVRNRWLVCDSKGNILPSNLKGPRGAVGHETKEDAERQLRAIEISKKAGLANVHPLDKELSEIITKSIIHTCERVTGKTGVVHWLKENPSKLISSMNDFLQYALGRNAYSSYSHDGEYLGIPYRQYVNNPMANSTISNLRIGVYAKESKTLGYFQASQLTIKVNAFAVLFKILYNNPFRSEITYRDIYPVVKNIVGHELLHAFDFSYQMSARYRNPKYRSEFEKSVRNNKKPEEDYPEYINRPTELKSWAHTIASNIVSNASDYKLVNWVVQGIDPTDIRYALRLSRNDAEMYNEVLPKNRSRFNKNLYLQIYKLLKEELYRDDFVSEIIEDVVLLVASYANTKNMTKEAIQNMTSNRFATWCNTVPSLKHVLSLMDNNIKKDFISKLHAELPEWV